MLDALWTLASRKGRLRTSRTTGTRLRIRRARTCKAGLPPRTPAAYGLSPPLFQSLTAYAARGRIFPCTSAETLRTPS